MAAAPGSFRGRVHRGTQQIGDGGPDLERRYEYALTYFEETAFQNLNNTTNQINTRGRWNTGSALANYVLPLSLHAVLLRKLSDLSQTAQNSRKRYQRA